MESIEGNGCRKSSREGYAYDFIQASVDENFGGIICDQYKSISSALGVSGLSKANHRSAS
jgi:hypothetical protein